MAEIRFYHLRTQAPAQALPGLLQKALAAGHRVVVRAAGEAEVAQLNDYLWTYNPDAFLPHGAGKDAFAADQPVWLTAGNDNPNGAAMLLLTAAEEAFDPENYTLCCDLFDGRDEGILAAARKRWAHFKAQGHRLTYWQQGEKGWEKKQEA